MTVLTEADIAAALRAANSDDPIERLAAWHQLARAGHTNLFVVGGRFLHCSLTESGRALKEGAAP